MSITYFEDLPQPLQSEIPEYPLWISGKLLVKRFVARDPLTGRAYFDAADLTDFYQPIKRHLGRRLEHAELGIHAKLSIHADMLKVKAIHSIEHVAPDTPTNGGLRGDVVGFSRASRKRLIEFMASVRYDTQLVLLTLTYPDLFPSEEEWNAHFEAFRRRFERRFPNYRAIWRKEIKKRKSGASIGCYVPHYHFLIWTDVGGIPITRTVKTESYGKEINKTVSGLSENIEAWALEAWSEIVASDDEKHAIYGAFACAVRNRRHAYSYVSKYIAKEDNDTLAVGRRWGRIGSFDTKASESVVLSQKEYIQFKRLVKRWMRSRERQSPNGKRYSHKIAQRSPLKGMTVFGLGDGLTKTKASPDYQRTVYRIIDHAIEIADDGIPLFQRE